MSFDQEPGWLLEVCGIETAPHRITVAEIVAVVCGMYGLPSLEVLSNRRYRQVDEARSIAMYAARRLTGMSFAGLGRLMMNRDHSSIQNAANKVAWQLSERNGSVARCLSTLAERLNVDAAILLDHRYGIDGGRYRRAKQDSDRHRNHGRGIDRDRHSSVLLPG
jgi:hypothetical protein